MVIMVIVLTKQLLLPDHYKGQFTIAIYCMRELSPNTMDCEKKERDIWFCFIKMWFVLKSS